MGENPTWEEAKAAAKLVPAESADAAVSPAQQQEGSVKEQETQITTEENPVVEEKAVDYKVELEKYKQQAEKAQKIADKRLEALQRIQKSKEKNLEEESKELAESSEGIDDLEALVEQKTNERLDAFKREQTSEVFDSVLTDLTDNEDERALIRAIYENDIKPQGFKRSDIVADLKKAYLLANAGRFEQQAFKRATEQIKKSIAQDKANEMATAASINTGKNPPAVDTNPPLSEKEQKWMDYLNKNKPRN